MSFFSRIFAGGKTAETVADTVKESAKSTFDLIDNAFFTEEEKSANKSKMLDVYAELIKSTTQENSGTSVARRVLMDKLTNFVLVSCALCIALEIAGIKYPDSGAHEAAGYIVEYVKKFWIGEAFAGGVAFYFLTHVARAARG
jgi:hypothetical protein